MPEQPTQIDQAEEWGPLVTPPNRRWWRSCGIWAMVGGCLFIGYGFLAPWLSHLRHHRGHGDGRLVVFHANQVIHALAACKEEYGSYPNQDTIAEVLKRHPEAKGLLRDTSSNDFFRQLIVTGHVDGELPFSIGYRRSDDLAKDKVQGKMLEPGECAFSYVVWGTDREIPQGAPLLMAPLIPGQLAFDPALAGERFSRKVFIGHDDGSVKILPMNRAGVVSGGGGKDFFDPSLPCWGGKLPRIAWPE